MPYLLRKVRNQECYRVMNKRTKRVLAKCSTKINAQKQIRLLNAIENNPNFKLRNVTRKRK